MRLHTGWMLCAALLTSCAYTPSQPLVSAHGLSECTAPDLRVFSYHRFPIAAHMREMALEETERHRSFTVSFSSSEMLEGDLREIRAEYRQLKEPGTHRLLVVFPVPGSVSWPQDRIRDMIILRQLPRKQKFHLLIMDTGTWFLAPNRFENLNSPDSFRKELYRHQDLVRAVVINARRLLDWMETRDEIDMKRIGVTGASVGGIFASLAMGSDARIASGLFMMAGADFGAIFGESKIESIRMIREAAYQKFGWSREKFTEVIREIFNDVDPLTWACAIPPRPAHIFIAEYDSYIPAASSWGLWERLGRQQMPLVFSAEHKSSFVGMSFLGGHRIERELIRFFSKTLQ